MESVRLGNTGLKVSRLALGCMSYGDPTTPGAHEWSLDDDDAQPFFEQAVELGHHLLGHREHLPGGDLGGGRRPRHQALLAARGHRARDQGVRQDARRPGRAGAVAQGDPGADRRLAGPAGYRLRRPLPDPPLRPGDPGRGDHGGAARRRQGRQGPLPRRVLDVRVAVRQAPARRRPRRLDAVRLDAEPVQPAAPPGRAAS